MSYNNNKTVDCFMYGGEDLLLSMRLKNLDPVVDYFVIVEGNTTHKGTPKKSQFDINKFKNYADKIIYNTVNLTSYNKPWDRENAQRNYIANVLQDMDLEDEDNILISDLDEIPDPTYISLTSDYRRAAQKIVFRMPFFYYNFKWIKKFECHGTTSVMWKTLKTTSPQSIRDSRFTDQYYHDAGWHCSFFGTPEQISNKIREYAHTEFSSLENQDINNIKHRMANGVDIYNRGPNEDLIPRPANVSLPPYIPAGIEY